MAQGHSREPMAPLRPQVEAASCCGWTKSISHHLRKTGMNRLSRKYHMFLLFFFFCFEMVFNVVQGFAHPQYVWKVFWADFPFSGKPKEHCFFGGGRFGLLKGNARNTPCCFGVGCGVSPQRHTPISWLTLEGEQQFKF